MESKRWAIILVINQHWEYESSTNTKNYQTYIAFINIRLKTKQPNIKISACFVNMKVTKVEKFHQSNENQHFVKNK